MVVNLNQRVSPKEKPWNLSFYIVPAGDC